MATGEAEVEPQRSLYQRDRGVVAWSMEGVRRGVGWVTGNGDLCLRDHSDFFGAVDTTGDDVMSAVTASLSSALRNWEKLCIRLIVDQKKGAPFNILLGWAAGTESHEIDLILGTGRVHLVLRINSRY